MVDKMEELEALLHLGMLVASSSAFALSVVICASIHVRPDDCNELTQRVTADPRFLDHWKLLITCISTECEDRLSQCMASI